MDRFKDTFFLILGLAVVVWSFYMFLQKPAPENSIIRIEKEEIIVEIADTEAERAQGLSGRTSLPEGHGLLFVFENIGFYGFWMKDMHFAIDIIFLDTDLRVINVYREVHPNTFPTLFYPLASTKYVLEINSGEASRVGIDTGVQVSLDR